MELESLVTVDSDDRTASSLKSDANTLFELKDYKSAVVVYKKAINRIVGDTQLEVGCLVLVSYSDSVDMRTGMISDVADLAYDVLLDDDYRHQVDEEVVVSADRLLVLASSPSDRLLQRSLYLNLARCATKLSYKGWAVKYASIALAISSLIDSECRDKASTVPSCSMSPEMDSVRLLADCLYFRGRSLLIACRPQLAKKVFKAELIQ